MAPSPAHRFGSLMLLLGAVVLVTGTGSEGSPGSRALECGGRVGTIYRCSQAAGERQLDRLARSARVEDAWIYLDAEQLWVDIGQNETTATVQIDDRPLRQLMDSAQRRAVRLTLYHIHPQRVLPPGRIYPADANDIYSEAHLKRWLFDRYGSSLCARVFDGDGVWTYDTTERLERSLYLPDYSGDQPVWPQQPRARPLSSPRDLMRQRYGDFLLDTIVLLEPRTAASGETRSQAITEYVRAAELMGIRLTYEPTHVAGRGSNALPSPLSP